jgi:hypothetical protein
VKGYLEAVSVFGEYGVMMDAGCSFPLDPLRGYGANTVGNALPTKTERMQSAVGEKGDNIDRLFDTLHHGQLLQGD